MGSGGYAMVSSSFGKADFTSAPLSQDLRDIGYGWVGKRFWAFGPVSREFL